MLYFDSANLTQSDELIWEEKLQTIGLNLLISSQNHRFYGKNELILKNESIIIFGQIQAKKSIQNDVLNHIANNFSNNNFDFLNDLDLGYNLIILFIISDEIFAIRDYFGIKPLYFSNLNQIKIISNSIQKIRNLNKALFEPNEYEIHHYLSDSYDDSNISSDTFFNGIERVLPGQLIQFKLDNTYKQQINQNFAINQTLENVNLNFRNGLEKQIDLIDQQLSNSCHLSGGLDSSSLAGLLSKNTKAIYFNTGLESTNEFDYANTAAKHYGIEIVELLNQNDILGKIKTTTKLSGQPECLVIPSYIFYDIHVLSKKSGCKNIISGHGGDAIVGTGFEWFEVLYKSNNESQLRDAFYKYNNFKRKYTYDNFILNKIKNQVYAFSLIKAISTYLKFKPNNKIIIKYIFDKLKSIKFKHQKSFLKINIKTKKAPKFVINDNLNNFQKNHINNNFISLGNHALEVSDAISEYFDSETFYPFLSKNLLKIAINTPIELNFDSGKGRGILRKAMEDVLPNQILNRVEKTSFSEYEYYVLKILWEQYGQFLKTEHKIWNYVKRDVYLNEINKILKKEINYQQNKNKTHLCCRILYLSIWLDQEF